MTKAQTEYNFPSQEIKNNRFNKLLTVVKKNYFWSKSIFFNIRNIRVIHVTKVQLALFFAFA